MALWIYLFLSSFIIFTANAREASAQMHDILGIDLSMPTNSALETIRTQFKTDDQKEISKQITVDGFVSKEISIAYICDITPTTTGEISSRFETKDKIVIGLNPNDSNQILSIFREKKYLKDERPLLSVFDESLRKKYGIPSSSSTDGNRVSWWTGPKDKSVCYITAESMGRPDIQFTNIISHLPRAMNCKTVKTLLTVSIVSYNGYVDSFEITLTNVETTIVEYEKYIRVVSSQAEQYAKEKHMKDSAITPQL